MKFRMVDKILEWQSCRGIRGVKAVSFEEYELKNAFGGDARLPESLLVESLFQLGNWLVMLSSDFQQMGMVKEFESVRFSGMLRPGQHLTINLQAKQYDEQCVVFDAQGCNGAKNIVEVEASVLELVSLNEYYCPEDLRVLYSEIGPIAPDYSRKNHAVK
jgi:3-hydroxymyristoyl/3-hydroxydecanoyl-(acyl carrier protein) dehydratase